MTALRDRISKLIREGRTLDEVLALKPLVDLDPKLGNGQIRPDQIVAEVYAI